MNKEAALKELSQLEERTKALRAIIDAPEKPALRHGDYGFDYQNCPCMEIQLQDGRGNTLHRSSMSKAYAYTCKMDTSNFKVENVLGNIFDDLKLYGEDCEKWEHDFHSLAHIQLNTSGNDVRIEMKYGSQKCAYYINSNDAITLANKIKQIAYTAKRKQG
jgi:hypothetical protein